MWITATMCTSFHRSARLIWKVSRSSPRKTRLCARNMPTPSTSDLPPWIWMIKGQAASLMGNFHYVQMLSIFRIQPDLIYRFLVRLTLGQRFHCKLKVLLQYFHVGFIDECAFQYTVSRLPVQYLCKWIIIINTHAFMLRFFICAGRASSSSGALGSHRSG